MRILDYLPLYLILLPGLLLPGCASRALDTADPVLRWGRFEQSFTAAEPAGPETAVTVHFTAPSGKTHAVPAFWDGETVWRVRFMPDEAGTWQYRAASEPAVPGLDGQEGRFESRAADSPSSRFLQHGPIRVSSNGRHFEHSDGTPFFWLGDTAWNGALRSEEEDWETYLADRADKQFTAIQFVTTQWRTATGNAAGEVAYTGFEDITINPAFFRQIDARIDAVNARGLLAVPVLLWTLGEKEQNPGQLPEDQAVRLARYMVARYGAHHVAWFLPGDGRYFDENAERWKRIGRAVFDAPGHAPVFIHPQGMQWPYDGFQDESWLSAFGYQSGHGDSPETLQWIHSGPPAQKWREGPPRPVINLEPPYEDHIAYQSKQPHSAYNVRRAVYWSLLNAPTAGVSYGAHGLWSWETEPGHEPLNHEGTGIAKPWHEAMRLPGSESMKHMADLFTSVAWWTLQPAPALVPEQPSDDPAHFVAASASAAGDLAVLYLPVGGDVRLNLGTLKPGLQAAWVNPRDGTRQPARPGAQDRFSAPDTQDWVLLFEMTDDA